MKSYASLSTKWNAVFLDGLFDIFFYITHLLLVVLSCSFTVERTR